MAVDRQQVAQAAATIWASGPLIEKPQAVQPFQNPA